MPQVFEQSLFLFKVKIILEERAPFLCGRKTNEKG